MEYLSWKFVAPKHRRRCASAARFKRTEPCTGAGAQYEYRVELHLFLGQRMKGLDKLSGGKVSVYPCDVAKQTPSDRQGCSRLALNPGPLLLSREPGLRLLPQLLRESPKKQRLSRLQKEVVAGKHPDREGQAGLFAPCFEIAMTHFLIIQTAESGNRAVERRSRRILVAFV